MSPRRNGNETALNLADYANVEPKLLRSLTSPQELRSMSFKDLEELAKEIRAAILGLSEERSIHFASNLGVVELTIALHYCFDFSWDRLVWDVGHQCYPHKLLTGRFGKFHSLRTHGGLSGYPNPEESPYDLFMTGHAGCSVGTALGLARGDSFASKRSDASSDSWSRVRHSIAVVGDGSFTSGPVFEALNHAGDLQQKMIVVLNDNQMSICPRVGGFGRYLDRARMAPGYLGAKSCVRSCVERLPNAYSLISRFKDAVRAGLVGGAFFQDLGFHYVGPRDGHDIPSLIEYFEAIKTIDGPVLLHVLTSKGHGFAPAESDPSHFHSSSPAKIRRQQQALAPKSALPKSAPAAETVSAASKVDESNQSFTYWAQKAIMKALRDDPRVCVVVAAMTQGNMLEKARAEFSDRFFDVGISEAHAVNFAAGLAKAGMRPIVDVYSGFLQRAYDHLFQEASLQNLPIVFSLDRSGFVGADGATHHGVFDLSYFRPFPNMTLVSPCDSADLVAAFEFALRHDGPVAIRYPKTQAGRFDRELAPYELGRAEVIREGSDGAFLVCGGLVQTALDAADAISRGELADVPALNLSVISARFVKPLDAETLLAPLRRGVPAVTVEENALAGGFGSAVLEAANSEGCDSRLLTRLGAPDYYIPHGSREEELAEAGIDKDGLLRAFSHVYRRSLDLKK